MDDVAVYDDSLVPIADDSLLMIAGQAERRIDAVIKIKQLALKVTNPSDWVDQNGKPYLMASGSEKIANLFNISWRIDEPRFEEEPDGHYTYTYTGVFSIPGRSVQVDGSRSSKDPFFRKYDWEKGTKVEKPISAIDRRDVKMAAMTNLLGNGITRLLGIRNLTYEDLAAFANLTKEMVEAINYKKRGAGPDKPPLREPQKKQEPGAPSTSDKTEEGVNHVIVEIANVTMKKDVSKSTGKEFTKYTVTDSTGSAYATFSESFAKIAKEAKETGGVCDIVYTTNKYGNNVVGIVLAPKADLVDSFKCPDTGGPVDPAWCPSCPKFQECKPE